MSPSNSSVAPTVFISPNTRHSWLDLYLSWKVWHHTATFLREVIYTKRCFSVSGLDYQAAHNRLHYTSLQCCSHKMTEDVNMLCKCQFNTNDYTLFQPVPWRTADSDRINSTSIELWNINTESDLATVVGAQLHFTSLCQQMSLCQGTAEDLLERGNDNVQVHWQLGEAPDTLPLHPLPPGLHHLCAVMSLLPPEESCGWGHHHTVLMTLY